MNKDFEKIDQSKVPDGTSIYGSWKCQKCGAPIGWLGRFMESLFGSSHKCNKK